MQWFRSGLVFKAHIFLYHSTVDLRVKKKKKKTRNLSALRLRERSMQNVIRDPSLHAMAAFRA